MVERAIERMTFEDLQEFLKHSDKAVVPVGTIEVHGYHGPLGFDNFIAEDVAGRLAETTDALLMPTVKYGCCFMAYDATVFNGSMTVNSSILSAYCTEIGTELARLGIKRIVFCNSHMGNSNALESAIYEIWKRSGAASGLLEHWVASSDIRGKLFTKPGHGGESETSLLMATKGSAFLKMDRAKAQEPQISPEEAELIKVGMNKYVQPLKASNLGDPTLATKEKGEEVIALLVKRGAALFEVLKKYVRSS